MRKKDRFFSFGYSVFLTAYFIRSIFRKNDSRSCSERNRKIVASKESVDNFKKNSQLIGGRSIK